MTFEEKLIEMSRRGESDKVKWFKNFEKMILPSQFKRLLNDDKSVWFEIAAPKWCTYSLLREWALSKAAKENNNKICVICEKLAIEGKILNEKYICNKCIHWLKENS